MKRKLLLWTIAVLCFASLASADSFVFYGGRAAQNPTDFIDRTQLGPDSTISGTPSRLPSW